MFSIFFYERGDANNMTDHQRSHWLRFFYFSVLNRLKGPPRHVSLLIVRVPYVPR
jgi:hypothetical protein